MIGNLEIQNQNNVQDVRGMIIMNLDKYWVKEKDKNCPFCHNNSLWFDTHPELDANYYCDKCNLGVLIIVCSMREKVK